MNTLPTLHLVTAVITGIYGVISLVGGIMGYVKAGSVASLVAGGVCGILLLLCAFGIARFPVLSLAVALIVALALAGRFGSVLARHRDDFSDHVATVGGTVGLIMIIGGALVVILAAISLAVKVPPTA
jgi:uncharacterized membrane protein (UPF0136 family)